MTLCLGLAAHTPNSVRAKSHHLTGHILVLSHRNLLKGSLGGAIKKSPARECSPFQTANRLLCFYYGGPNRTGGRVPSFARNERRT